MPKVYFNIKLEQELTVENANYTVLSLKYGISRPTVRAYAKRLGLYNINNRHMHQHDKSYFKNINTANKAYVLGLMYADGCNIRKGFSIALHENDKEVVDFVRKELKTTVPLKKITPFKKNWSYKWELRITSKEISNDLTNLGCTPAKSTTLSFPTGVPENLMSHFIRGYFDGDGSMWENKGGWHASFTCASDNFIKGLKEYLDNLEKNYKEYLTGPKKNCHSIILCRRKSIRLLVSHMYQGKEFGMLRKQNKITNFLNT